MLKELLQSGKEIAEIADDDVQLSYYIKIEKKLNRLSYTEFKNHEAEFLWYLADTGMIMANTAENDATEDDLKEKAIRIAASYMDIKNTIEESIRAVSPRILK